MIVNTSRQSTKNLKQTCFLSFFVCTYIYLCGHCSNFSDWSQWSKPLEPLHCESGPTRNRRGAKKMKDLWECCPLADITCLICELCLRMWHSRWNTWSVRVCCCVYCVAIHWNPEIFGRYSDKGKVNRESFVLLTGGCLVWMVKKRHFQKSKSFWRLLSWLPIQAINSEYFLYTKLLD